MHFYILNKKVCLSDDKGAFEEGCYCGKAAAHARICSNGCLYKTWINEGSMNTVHPHHAHSFVAMVPHQPRARKKIRLPDVTLTLDISAYLLIMLTICSI